MNFPIDVSKIKVIDSGTILDRPNMIMTPANLNTEGMVFGNTYLVYGLTNVHTGTFSQFQDGELDFIGDPDMDYMTKRFRLSSLESLFDNSYISRLDLNLGKGIDLHELHLLGRDLDFFPNEPRLSRYYFDKVLRKDSKTGKKDEEQRENRKTRDTKLKKLDQFLLETTTNQKIIDRVLKRAVDREKERLNEMKREEEKKVKQNQLRQNTLQAKERGKAKDITLPSYLEPKIVVKKITTQDLINERMREIEKKDELIKKKETEKARQTREYIKKKEARKKLERETEEYYDAVEAGLREEDLEYEKTLYFYDSEDEDEENFPLVFESI